MTTVKQLAAQIALRVAEGATPREEYANAVRGNSLTVGACAALRTEIDLALAALLRSHHAALRQAGLL